MITAKNYGDFILEQLVLLDSIKGNDKRGLLYYDGVLFGSAYY